MRVKFTPEPLLSCQKPYHLGLDVVDENPDVIFNWNWTGTHFKRLPGTINGGCINTSKVFVNEVFEAVYGYSSEAAPDSFAVEKPNNTNGFKDCRLINPYDKRKEGCFYQIPLHDFKGIFTEYRITIINYKPVITVQKDKIIKINDLIGDIVSAEMISAEYDERIMHFCMGAGMQYGELDCCDYKGKFYIFDMNPTPGDALFKRKPPVDGYFEIYKKLFTEWISGS